MDIVNIPSLMENPTAPLVVAFVLTTLLKAVKNAPSVADWTIPIWAFFLGGAIYLAMVGLTGKNFILGGVIGLGAVGINQGSRQIVTRVKDGPETDETREFRRRFEKMTDEKVSQASQGGPQAVVVTTPSQPSKVEVISKDQPEKPKI